MFVPSVVRDCVCLTLSSNLIIIGDIGCCRSEGCVALTLVLRSWCRSEGANSILPMSQRRQLHSFVWRLFGCSWYWTRQRIGFLVGVRSRLPIQLPYAIILLDYFVVRQLPSIFRIIIVPLRKAMTAYSSDARDIGFRSSSVLNVEIRKTVFQQR